MNDAYRTKPAPAPTFEAPPLRHQGPRSSCPVCGTGSIRSGKACHLGMWRWSPLGPCQHYGTHLHQKCWFCEASWTCDPIEEGYANGPHRD